MCAAPSLRPPAVAPPIACTLAQDAVPDRLADWQAVLDRVRSRTPAGDGSLRLEFDDGVDVGELARLAAAEQQCCGFFSFALTVDPRGIGLEVAAPIDAGEIVAALFGARP